MFRQRPTVNVFISLLCFLRQFLAQQEKEPKEMSHTHGHYVAGWVFFPPMLFKQAWRRPEECSCAASDRESGLPVVFPRGLWV